MKRTFKREKQTLVLETKGTSLSIDGKATTYPTAGAALEQLLDVSRKRLAQGWMPTTPAKEVTKLVAAIEKERLGGADWMHSISDDEVAIVYRQLQKTRDFSSDLMRKRPQRQALEWALQHYDKYQMADLGTIVKITAREHPWVIDVLTKTKKMSPAGAKFAARWAKSLGAAKPVAPKKPAKGEDETELLRAIAAAPSDDGPRAVYADWLLDRGNKMGELIHMSLKLPEFEVVPRKVANKLASEWLDPIRKFMRSWSFGRGSLDRVQTEGALYVQAADAIALRAPRATLLIAGIKPAHIAAIAASPLGTFRTVNLSSQRLTDDQIEQIVSSPTFAGVEMLAVGYNPFGDRGVLAIANSPSAQTLRDLDVDGRDHELQAATVNTLVQSLPKLTAMRARVTSVDGVLDGAKQAFEELALSSTKKVDAATYLAVAKQFPELRSLWLGAEAAPKNVEALLEKRRVS